MNEDTLKSCRVILATKPRDEEGLPSQALLSLTAQIEQETRQEAVHVLATEANL